MGSTAIPRSHGILKRPAARGGLALVAVAAGPAAAAAHEGHAHGEAPSAAAAAVEALAEHWPALALVALGALVALWLVVRLRRRAR